MRRFLPIVLFALAAPVLLAQGYRFDTSNSVIPGATVAVCSHPATIVNGVCTNYATTYTDATLTTQCSTSGQVVLNGTNTCVGSSDSQGNWGIWIMGSHQYDYTYKSTAGQTYGPFTFTAPIAQAPISVKDYGAVGDSNPQTYTGTDDTAAIQAALTAAGATIPPSGVYIPHGNYCIGTITVPMGVAVWGEGLQTKLLHCSSLSNIMMDVYGSHHHIHDLFLDGNPSGSGVRTFGFGNPNCLSGTTGYGSVSGGLAIQASISSGATSATFSGSCLPLVQPKDIITLYNGTNWEDVQVAAAYVPVSDTITSANVPFAAPTQYSYTVTTNVKTTADTTLNSKVITVPSSSGISVGNVVVNTSGIPFGTLVTNVSGTTITLSNLATNSGAGVPITFQLSTSAALAETDIKFDHNTIIGQGAGFDTVSSWHVIGGSYTDNSCWDAVDTCVDFPSGGNRNISVIGNTIRTSGKDGIAVDQTPTELPFGNSGNFAIADNKITMTGGTTPLVGINLNGGGVPDQNISVSGNIIDVTRAGGSGVGIEFANPIAGVTVSANTINCNPSTSGQQGIYYPGLATSAAINATVQGNLIAGCYNGIWLYQAPIADVIGNMVMGSANAAIQVSNNGIVSQVNKILGNTVTGNPANGIWVQNAGGTSQPSTVLLKDNSFTGFPGTRYNIGSNWIVASGLWLNGFQDNPRIQGFTCTLSSGSASCNLAVPFTLAGSYICTGNEATNNANTNVLVFGNNTSSSFLIHSSNTSDSNNVSGFCIGY